MRLQWLKSKVRDAFPQARFSSQKCVQRATPHAHPVFVELQPASPRIPPNLLRKMEASSREQIKTWLTELNEATHSHYVNELKLLERKSVCHVIRPDKGGEKARFTFSAAPRNQRSDRNPI